METKKVFFHKEAHEDREDKNIMDKKEAYKKKVLVTGSSGFIGKNLIEGLRRHKNIEIRTFDAEDDLTVLRAHLGDADIVFHLAGVNRPEKDEEFEAGNAGLTLTMLEMLEEMSRFLNTFGRPLKGTITPEEFGAYSDPMKFLVLCRRRLQLGNELLGDRTSLEFDLQRLGTITKLNQKSKLFASYFKEWNYLRKISFWSKIKTVDNKHLV